MTCDAMEWSRSGRSRSDEQHVVLQGGVLVHVVLVDDLARRVRVSDVCVCLRGDA